MYQHYDNSADTCICYVRDSSQAKQAVVESAKRVLILGAGYVSAPVVDYLTRDPTIGVTVGKLFHVISIYIL